MFRLFKNNIRKRRIFEGLCMLSVAYLPLWSLSLSTAANSNVTYGWLVAGQADWPVYGILIAAILYLLAEVNKVPVEKKLPGFMKSIDFIIGIGVIVLAILEYQLMQHNARALAVQVALFSSAKVPPSVSVTGIAIYVSGLFAIDPAVRGLGQLIGKIIGAWRSDDISEAEYNSGVKASTQSDAKPAREQGEA